MAPKRSHSRGHGTSEAMEPHSESTVIRLNPDDLPISFDQVARYAGGARYRPDARQLRLAQKALKKARLLAKPVFVYRVHEVRSILQGGYAELGNGITFPLASDEEECGTVKALAFCICTIGSALEKAIGALLSAGDTLEGLFLDAAGVAFLDALSTRAYETLQSHARHHLLQAGCRFGPGYEGLALSYQSRLFALVDASAIGVRLNRSCVMSPAKSLSFVTAWTTSQHPPKSRSKCAACTLPHCPYRLYTR